MSTHHIDLCGETTKTESELRAYIQSIRHEWTASTYNLITHNCNNYSDTICRFLLGHGIDESVVDLPRIVFSTPRGAVFRPIIEQMTNSINGIPHTMDPFAAQMNGGGTATTGNGYNNTGAGLDFGNMLSGVPGINVNTPTVPAREVTRPTATARIAALTLSKDACLQNLPSLSDGGQGYQNMIKRVLAITVSATEEAELPTEQGGSSSDRIAGGHGPCSFCKRRFTTEAAFNQHMVDMPCKTLLNTSSGSPRKTPASPRSPGSPTKAESTADGVSYFSAEEILVLTSLESQLGSVTNMASFQCEPEVYAILMRALEAPTVDSKTITAVLFLLRLLVMAPTENQPSTLVDNVLVPLLALLKTESYQKSSILLFGLCVLGNYLNHNRYDDHHAQDNEKMSSIEAVLESIIDISCICMSNQQKEVRQIACMVAYNCILLFTASTSTDGGSASQGSETELSSLWAQEPFEIHSFAVQLLCTSLDGISDEKDPVTRKRKLSIALRIIRAYLSINGTVVELINDLGLPPSIESVAVQVADAQTSNGSGEDTSDEKYILSEMLLKLRPTVNAQTIPTATAI
jgi:hypothetical protein